MKIILLHSDFIEFEPKKKALKDAEKVKEKKTKVKDCLVVFSAVERADENNVNAVVENCVKEIKDVAKQIKTKTIVLYPWVHLTKEPSSPKTALNVLKKAETSLKKNYKVTRAPFGWYKQFDIKCKGHPLAELSRDIGSEKVVSEAVKKEAKLKSYWYIMQPNGKLVDTKKFNFKGRENLEKFARYEMEKSRLVKKEPAHIKLMKKLELADYEPGSDLGNLRFYPKGRLVKSLIEEYVNKRTIAYGGLEVETPILYDMNHPTFVKYLNRFPARQYQMESDKRNFFLRFSACFGQFLMAHDAIISYKNLPLKLYEMTKYSFRREQSGELTGLRRLRAFTMPDVHAICENLKQAIDEYKVRFKLCVDIQEKMGLEKDDLELAVRVTKDFYNKNKDLVKWLVKSYAKPALIEIWDEKFFYFILKYELNFVDSVDKASALSTDQIDVENAERYGITFIDKKGKEQYPLILHCCPSGAIERVIYVLLEKASMKKGTPTLPLWLSPTQVRICTVSQGYNRYAEKIAQELGDIRVDIDDRDESVGRKVRDAETEWVNYILVIGAKEKKTGKLMVRIRETGKQKQMKAKELVKEIKSKTKDMPYKPLPLPRLISKRPKFVG